MTQNIIYNPIAALGKNTDFQKYEQEALARIKLAEALYQERKVQKMTINDLAKLAHTTPAVISRIEHCQVSAGIDLVARLFTALGKQKITLSFM